MVGKLLYIAPSVFSISFPASRGLSRRGKMKREETTSFPGSLFSASLGRWKKDPGCGWSRYHPESGWQKNLLSGRGGRVFCLVDVTDFVDFKFSSSR